MEKDQATTQTAEHVVTLPNAGSSAAKQARVLNIAYSDAIAKDNQSPWATAMLKLYAVSLTGSQLRDVR